MYNTKITARNNYETYSNIINKERIEEIDFKSMRNIFEKSFDDIDIGNFNHGERFICKIKFVLDLVDKLKNNKDDDKYINDVLIYIHQYIIRCHIIFQQKSRTGVEIINFLKYLNMHPNGNKEIEQFLNLLKNIPNYNLNSAY